MTPQELEHLFTARYGTARWKTRLAKRLGVDKSTVWRILKRKRVPGPVEAAVRCWTRLR